MNDKSSSKFPRGIYGFAGDTLNVKLSLEEQLNILLAAGIRCIQIRLKATADAEALEMTAKAVECCKAQGALCMINDRIDMALMTEASGVHLGDEDLPVSIARRLLGSGALIGKTVRHLEGAQLAEEEGADYIGLGPIFATQTKLLCTDVLGIEELTYVAKHSPLPVVAIAGISVFNIAEVARAQAHAAAVISDIWQAPEPGRRASELQALFARAVPS